MDVRTRRRRYGWSETWVRQLATGCASTGAVLCFPPAGGGANVFQSWLGHLPDDIDLYVVQPPGREDRHDEEPGWDADRALDCTAEALARHRTGLDVVFGHSLGALLALHFVARYGGAVGDPRLVLSSVAPPAPAAAAPQVDLALAVANIRRTAAGAWALSELPADMRAALERRWLADLRVQVSLSLPGHPPRSAVTVWAGEDDVIGADELRSWERIVSVRELRRWPGSHDYPFSSSVGPVVAELVRLTCAAPTSGPAPVPADRAGRV